VFMKLISYRKTLRICIKKSSCRLHPDSPFLGKIKGVRTWPDDFYPHMNQASLADLGFYPQIQVRHFAKISQILSELKSGILVNFQGSSPTPLILHHIKCFYFPSCVEGLSELRLEFSTVHFLIYVP
jgi:hypothetical protein